MHARPLIAINGELDVRSGERLSMPNQYAAAVLRAGGRPLATPALAAPAFVEELLDVADGLVLCGGDDFDTERLGLGRTHPKAKPVPTAKQDFDVALARAALARATPVLGVCYGMQLLALVGGGTLLQHLPEDRPGAQPHAGGAVHPVRVAPAAKLAGILRVESIDVVSRHHQAVAGVGADWRVGASDDEGLIEAVEHCSHPFAVGVQWHPELSGAGLPGGPRHAELFRALVDAARSHRAARTTQRAAGALAP
jgi:putative glutamine amidotransferase